MAIDFARCHRFALGIDLDCFVVALPFGVHKAGTILLTRGDDAQTLYVFGPVVMDFEAHEGVGFSVAIGNGFGVDSFDSDVVFEVILSQSMAILQGYDGRRFFEAKLRISETNFSVGCFCGE